MSLEKPQSAVPIESLISVVRGQKVILDSDLARIYGVKTKRLNEQVRRNPKRFPPDFVFQLTQEEAQFEARSRSQIATLKQGQNIKYLPNAFTEHGAIMTANVLNSDQAVQMSVFVVRAFVKMREVLANNHALAQKLAELERKLTDRLDVHEKAIVHVLGEIRKLMTPPPLPPEPPRKQIGFQVRERRAVYVVRQKRQRTDNHD
ncbi:MAG: ORF6N domain-containing protein [Verrucomicrobiia bacterium]|jgi:phage regulator Rha-like protein